jgi:phosphoesterase RecJ-like protein
MFYKQSRKILLLIKKSKNILINTHKNPDYDSIGSALVLKNILKKLGKKAKIISCQKINPYFFFLKEAENIETINYSQFDFSPFDLFIIPDTGNSDRVTGSKEINLPKNLQYIVIDHHKTNEFSRYPKILDQKASATCEILYFLFSDWKIKIDPGLADYLLTGIMGDTVFLRYAENSKKTFTVVSDLIKKGADKDLIAENFYERYDFKAIKLLGEFLNRMKKEKNFIWSAVPFEIFDKYGQPEGVREMAADLFFRGIAGSDFGVAMLESKKGVINLSFRSKKNTDVTKYARLFDGGGHKNAAGATVKGKFETIVKNILRKIS